MTPSPCPPFDRLGDGGPVNTEAIGDGLKRLAGIVTHPRGRNLLRREPQVSRAELHSHVKAVLLPGSEEEMLWVAAFSDIAAVKHAESGPSAVRQEPRDAMSEPSHSQKLHCSVALVHRGPRPEPAAIGLFDIRPKPANRVSVVPVAQRAGLGAADVVLGAPLLLKNSAADRALCESWITHGNSPAVGRGPGRVEASRGLFLVAQGAP